MMMKKILFIAVILAVVLGGCSSTFKSLQPTLPDMSGISDGTYRGQYSVSGTPVKVTLEVVIQNRRITAINLVRHIRSPIGKKAETITDDIISHQSLDVDVVSGATASSKAILMAVEDALKQGD
jgi:uncharacterized protein with FMN-binding domain